MEEKIIQVIEKKISRLLAAHGGSVKFLGVTPEGEVSVQLRGACGSCPASQQTLKYVVEDMLKAEIPEVKSVQAVSGVSDELIEEAYKILGKDKRG